MSCSRAFAASRSVCSLGIGTASLSSSSATVANTGAACANSGNTTSRTGRNGALPATAESIIDSMRSVFARICRRSSGFGKIGLAGGGGVTERHSGGRSRSSAACTAAGLKPKGPAALL